MGIQRWTPPGSEIDLAENGDFVLFTDHEQVVDKWKRLAEEARDNALNAEAEATRLRAELAAKSKDAAAVVKHAREVVAWFSSGNSVPIDGVHTMKVSNHSITTDIWQLRQALEAMGEGNER